MGPHGRIGAHELIEDRAHSVTFTARTAATLVVVFGPAVRWAAGDLDVAAALGATGPVTGIPRPHSGLLTDQRPPIPPA